MTFPEKSRFVPETAQPLLVLAENIKGGPAWLETLRGQAREALKHQGLPTPKLERWQYTNLRPLVKDFGAKLAGVKFVHKGPDKLVRSFGDDIPAWLADKDQGVFRYGDMGLWELGNLFLQDGLSVDVPAGKAVDEAVEITLTGSEGFSAPRLAVRLGEGAELTLVETRSGQGKYWTNGITQIVLGPNAKLRHYRVQDNGLQAVDTQNTQVRIARDATYESFTLTTGAAMSRNQIHAALEGANAACNIYGVNLLRGGQHGDTTVEVEHRAAHCASSQFMRSIIGGHAHGVFQGKVYVAKDAQKTDGTQLSNAILLSEGAEMDTKPELEIYADDVKCGHGATTGRLEEDPLFYLRSRGIPETEARALLLSAFVSEVVEKLADEAVKDTIRQRVEGWLKDA